ncbi:hypothetical protein [Motilibacter deserti]|uniref:Uncharacterized protein n=1 Tax=Motilibacter deserti TaxID=2714956 RepID=A0ABX0GQX7_9ACTN|nr:hypothetical protein [Motilibacter deserti]NHC13256.1 hypothetical protein [Motilibacter deserti]
MTETPFDDAPRTDAVEGSAGAGGADVEREAGEAPRTDVEGIAFGDETPAPDLTPDDPAVRGT